MPSALFGALRDDRAFVVLFTSVSGAFGNKGQVDYGAANDALDTLAWSVGHRVGRGGCWRSTGVRGPGPAWCPPSSSGSTPGAGWGWSTPDDGIDKLLAELAAPVSEPEIVLARARVATFEPTAADPVGHGAV